MRKVVCPPNRPSNQKLSNMKQISFLVGVSVRLLWLGIFLIMLLMAFTSCSGQTKAKPVSSDSAKKIQRSDYISLSSPVRYFFVGYCYPVPGGFGSGGSWLTTNDGNVPIFTGLKKELIKYLKIDSTIKLTILSFSEFKDSVDYNYSQKTP